jgi:ATP-dependent Clp protease ATP-binding subunit ClpB
MDKLTTQFQQAMQDAQSLAVGRDNQYIEPVHLMSALLEQQGGQVQGILTKAGVNMNLLRSQLGGRSTACPPSKARCTSNDLGKLWECRRSSLCARAPRPRRLFLLAAVQSKTGSLANLDKAAEGRDRKAIEEVGGGRPTTRTPRRSARRSKTPSTSGARGRGSSTRDRATTSPPHDQVLQRRTKNNPLIGEPGVGKTAIVEGLAQRIVNGKFLRGSAKARAALDMGAGSRARSSAASCELRLRP